MSSIDDKIRQCHLEAWGYCPQCQKEPRQPHGERCENCEGLDATKFHGKSQAIKFERRILNDGRGEYNT